MTDKGMSEESLQNLLSSEIEDALNYIHGTEYIADQRETNYNYMRGQMDDLPAPLGRSKVTDRTVSSYINMMLPSLLRIFTAGKNIAQYEPMGEEDEQIADLITRYVNEIVFRKDNTGELIMRDWAWDALVTKVGIVKAYWDEDSEEKEETYEGLNDIELVQLVQQVEQTEGVEITAHTATEVINQDPMSGMEIVSEVHDVTITRTINKSRIVIESMQNEDFVISRDARSLEDAVLKSHRTYVRAGDLIADGYDRDKVDKLPTYTEHRFRRRQFDEEFYKDRNRTDAADPMLREVLVHQGIVKCDYDGTGVKEWFFVAGGDSNLVEILKMEPYECQIVFADFCPEPVPGLFWGRCPADSLVELQKVNTVLTRQMLDSAYLSNTPQREVVFDWLVNPNQLSNMAPGAPVYVSKPGGIREIAVKFIGGEVLPLLNRFDSEAEMRTGVSKAAMGLDPETLTNQSATAANIAHSASAGKVEMIARIWADGGMRKLFRGILKMLIKYQDFARVVRMDGKAQSVDPREWERFSEMDVSINTGLGTGNRDRDAAYLGQILAMGKEVIAQFGPQNPIFPIDHLSKVMQKFTEAVGIRNGESIFPDVEPQVMQAWVQSMNKPPPPDPRMLEVERKAKKDQGDAQFDMATILLKARELALKEAQMLQSQGQQVDPLAMEQLQLKYQDMLMKDERERLKMGIDAEFRGAELAIETRLEKYAIDKKAPQGQGRIPN